MQIHQAEATIRSFWYARLALRWGIPSPHFLMKWHAIRQLLRDRSQRRLLDAGCANGLNSLLIAQRCQSVERVDGFDISEQSIGRAQGLAQKLRSGITAQFWVGDLDQERLTQCYDLVLYIDCIQYAKKPKHFLHEIAGHLLSEGRMILYTPVTDGYHVRVPRFVEARQPKWPTRPPNCGQLLDWLAQAGFEIEGMTWVGKRWYRIYKTWEYWLRSYSKGYSYLFLPIGLSLACTDRFMPEPGSGIFVIARCGK